MNNSKIYSLQEVLAQYAGVKVFFDELEGNNGDTLITMGSLHEMQKFGMRFVKKPELADVIIVNGGGGITDIWSHGLKKIKKYNNQYPEIPLIIFPSSFFFKSTNFAGLFTPRKSPAYIFARERYSLQILQAMDFSEDVAFGIDNDMALFLEDSQYLSKLRLNAKGKHILIVERNDPETTTRTTKKDKNNKNRSTWLQAIKRKIPRSAKRNMNKYFHWPIKRLLYYPKVASMDIQRPFVQEQISLIHKNYPKTQGLPIVAADISDPKLCDFGRFSNLIANAEVVVSTRLHVGILASMLGKPTYLKTGSYHKIRGIYEYSLAEKDHIHLIDDVPVNS